MTILHAGHEGGMVRLTGSASYTTSNGFYNTSFSRCALQTAHYGGHFAYVDVAADIDGNGLWFHAYGRANDAHKQANSSVIQWRTAGGDAICEILTNSSSNFVLRLLNQSASDAAITNDLGNTALYTIDMHVYYADGKFIAEFYLHGLLAASTEATGSSQSLSSIRLGSQVSAFISGYAWVWSEIIVATDDTRGMHVKSAWPNGAGQYTESTGGYANVDEVVTDALVAEFTAIDQRLLMTHSGVGTPKGQIIAVALGGQANADATSAPAAMFRAGDGQEHVDAQPLTTNPVLYDFKRLYFVNPITGQPWTVADLNAMQVGVKAIAR